MKAFAAAMLIGLALTFTVVVTGHSAWLGITEPPQAVSQR